MIEQAQRSSDAADACGLPRAWVCVFEHPEAIDAWVCATEEAAYRELAAVGRLFWEEAREVDKALAHPEREQWFPVEPPDDDRATVEGYFALMAHAIPAERYLIAAREVIDGGEEGR